MVRPPNSVTLIEVLHICEPAIIRFFLDRGADFITGEPFAFAFRDKNSNRSRKWALEQLASRYNRDEIYRDIWSEPIQRGAKRYGLSDVGRQGLQETQPLPDNRRFRNC